MSKFNKRSRKCSRKIPIHLGRAIKKTMLLKEIIDDQPKMIRGIIRESKYRKKTESNIRKKMIVKG